jgi:peptide/nickel transport system permease protein
MSKQGAPLNPSSAIHPHPALAQDRQEMMQLCARGADLLQGAKTIEDCIHVEQFFRAILVRNDSAIPELYSGLGDALSTRFYKFESENWELLRQAYQAYWNALEMDAGYRPAQTSLRVIERYSKLSVNPGLSDELAEASLRQAPAILGEHRQTRPGKWEMIRQRFVPVISFLSNRRNLVPLLMVGFFFVVAIFAPLISPPADAHNPLPYKLVESFDPNPLAPGEGMPWGTVVYNAPVVSMLLHYNVFHSVVWGTRDALRFGLMVALVSAMLGALVGAVSGYAGGVFNDLTMRLTDAFLAIPIIAGVWLIQSMASNTEMIGNLFVIWYPNLDAVVAPLTARQRLMAAIGLDPVLLAFILFSWMPYARLINAGFLRLKNVDYIMAARVIGAPSWRLIFRHLLPNAITPIIVLLARDIGAVVVLRAAFSFIGLGGSIEGGLPEWDRLLLLGRTWVIGVGGNILVYWWTYLPATLALILFGVSWNMFGDRLNVLLNPRQAD